MNGQALIAEEIAQELIAVSNVVTGGSVARQSASQAGRSLIRRLR